MLSAGSDDETTSTMVYNDITFRVSNYLHFISNIPFSRTFCILCLYFFFLVRHPKIFLILILNFHAFHSHDVICTETNGFTFKLNEINWLPTFTGMPIHLSVWKMGKRCGPGSNFGRTGGKGGVFTSNNLSTGHTLNGWAEALATALPATTQGPTIRPDPCRCSRCVSVRNETFIVQVRGNKTEEG